MTNEKMTAAAAETLERMRDEAADLAMLTRMRDEAERQEWRERYAALGEAIDALRAAGRCEAALRNAVSVFESQLERQKNCGDPDAECPLQDAHKERYEYEVAGALRIAREALQRAGGAE